MKSESDPCHRARHCGPRRLRRTALESECGPDVSVELSQRPQVVEVRGLERASIRSLERLPPNDTTWPRFVAVYVEGTAGDSASTPPVIGRYAASSDRVRFEPRFPFAEGVAYRVEVDTAMVARGGAATSSTVTRPARLTH